MYSSVLLERQRHFLVWSTVNLSAPILVLKSDSVALEVEDFQMTEHMSVLKVADSLTTNADSLYTFNFETKTLRPFQEQTSAGLSMIACGPNTLIGLIK